MKQYMLKKRLFAIVFLGVLFIMSGLNFMHSFPLVLKDLEKTEEFQISKLDASITENLMGRMAYIETYGYIQILLGKQECNNFTYIKDQQGFLHYASFFREEDSRLFEYAIRMKRLQNYVEKNGTKVLFVVPPGKYNANHTKLRTGLPINNPDSTVDELLFYLNRLGVETLDLRQKLPNDEISYENTFFKTDHHWTIPAAFYATREIVDKIEESFEEKLDPKEYYTDINTYEIKKYPGVMLGSMGRKTGANFSGLESFEALWPKFEGNYTREFMQENGKLEKRSGDFVQALMEPSVLTKNDNIYSDSNYSLYLNGLRIYENIINHDNKEGPSMFMIRDSYFSPVISFLMPMCSSIEAMWSLEDTRELDIENYVKEKQFDYIIVEVYPYNINNDAFNFFKEETLINGNK